MGPSIDPCGTPDKINSKRLYTPFTRVYFSLLVRYESMYSSDFKSSQNRMHKILLLLNHWELSRKLSTGPSKLHRPNSSYLIFPSIPLLTVIKHVVYYNFSYRADKNGDNKESMKEIICCFIP